MTRLQFWNQMLALRATNTPSWIICCNFFHPSKKHMYQIVQGFRKGSSFVPIFAELFPPSHPHLSRLRRWYGSPYEDRGRLVGQLARDLATLWNSRTSKMSLRLKGVRSRCNLGGSVFATRFWKQQRISSCVFVWSFFSWKSRRF